MCQRKEAKGKPNSTAVKTDVTNNDIIVGNLLWKISAAFSLFLHWSGTIVCEVTDSKQLSADLEKEARILLCTLKNCWTRLRIGTKIAQISANTVLCNHISSLQSSSCPFRISRFAMSIIMA